MISAELFSKYLTFKYLKKKEENWIIESAFLKKGLVNRVRILKLI